MGPRGVPADQPLYYSWRARETQPKADLNYSGTIACFDGVLIKPDGPYNSVRLLSSDEHKSGKIDIKLDPKNLDRGDETLKEMSSQIKLSAKRYKISEILPFGIVVKSKRDRGEFNTFHFDGDHDHTIYIETIRNNDQTHTWKCSYDIKTGEIQSLYLVARNNL